MTENQPLQSDQESQVTDADRAAAESSVTVSRWAIHRRMYDWMIGYAHHPKASAALFGFSFAESSFFPIPPDVLLAPMCLGDRKKSFRFALICTIASVLGAVLGYVIGMYAIDLAIEYVPGISQEAVDKLNKWFVDYGEIAVLGAALTPVPFKVLTVASGGAGMNFPIFVIACIVGRGVRFFGVAGVFYLIGPKAVPFIDKYFNWISIGFLVLLAGGFYLIKFMN